MSKWDSPTRQESSSSYRSKRKDRDRSPEESRSKYREEESRSRYRDDDSRNKNRDDDRRRKSPERKKSPDRRDRRDRDRDVDRRQKSRSRSRDRQRGDREYPDRNRDERRRSRDKTWQNNKNRRRRNEGEDDANYEWGRRDDKEDPDEKPQEKEKPNFALSGKLTEESNKVHGIVIKYAEPPEAKKPKRRWRLYPFKGETALPVLYIHRQSGYLIGRDRKICDVAVDHPSCSKQHAALQFRLVPYEREDGSTGKRVRPYIIDLESANGTFVNNKQIEAKKYVELLEKDVIKFGFSSREYVLLHESSKEDAEDDDMAETENEEVNVKEEEK
ncbi:unnamed protein product [Chironomus riparius]|uniref:FHA domain-containing protein n=1 Tax=Chironomus riparius TaxID=315576 RepID=A0A9N9RTJ3_9DIPT|nr:unnamed protein product [Chironomus riparius]